MQCNGTDSQESPINNNNLNREIERLIANDTEEKLKGYGFMKRLKKRKMARGIFRQKKLQCQRPAKSCKYIQERKKRKQRFTKSTTNN